jgi:hypothetical protein
MTMNPFSEVSVMITPRKSERGSKPTPKGDDYSLSIALARSRAESASKAAAEKLQAEQDASAEQDEVANALVDIMESKPTPELIAEVSQINNTFLNELSQVQADYEVDINDKERKKLMTDFELRSLDKFATALYGEVGVAQIKKAYGNQGAIRKFFENYSGDQCQGALQKTNPFIPGKSLCWICGFVIPDVPPGTGFSMECEHVLPIAQAVFFIDLYRGKHTPQSVVRLVQAEYDWAHRVCNQIKNDTHFLRIAGDGANKKWQVCHPDVRVAFLKDLVDRSKLYFKAPGDQENLLLNSIKDSGWFKERAIAISVRIREVLEVGVNNCFPGIFTIIQVGKCLDRYDSQIVKDDSSSEAISSFKRRRVGSGTRRKKRKGTRRIKRTN